MKRSAGILLPVSSLPSRYGIGCFSQEAFDFVDWLRDAGQSYWQILPLFPTSFGDSPYQSFSTFAGNPYFICAGPTSAAASPVTRSTSGLCRKTAGGCPTTPCSWR